uniref:Delta-like protein D-like n=1 Tax=Saccoglossus kowalevskii TaxID=10224 RepID=A0ABM0MCX1_SACKO|nr:PREDICTED: delta-like protein D-like [Saccoglossus kowalevskii]
MHILNSAFGDGHSVLLVNIGCNGNESTILNCLFSVMDGSQCSTSHAGVYCNYPGYTGCFADDDNDQPYIGGESEKKVKKIRNCINHCQMDFTYASIRDTSECRCGEDFPGDKNSLVHNDRCDLPCQNKVTEMCGGNHASSVYSTTLGSCTGTLNETKGWLFSPNFPGNYPKNSDCQWTVQVPLDFVIEVTLRMLRLNDGDQVSFYNISGLPQNHPVILTNDNSFQPYPCANDPCQNGANCTDSLKQFICHCSEGWEGTTCEDRVNPCQSNPCVNDGKCQWSDGDISYHCDCPDDRIGQHCDTGLTGGGIAVVMVSIIIAVSVVVILRKKKTESNSTQSSPTLDNNADYEGIDINTIDDASYTKLNIIGLESNSYEEVHSIKT